MKRHLSVSILSLVAFSITASAGRCAEAEKTRDPAYWPFATTSPWNMPIGDKAQYGEIHAPHFDPAAGGGMNCGWWSHPIFIATERDPRVTIYLHPRYLNVAEKAFITMRVPADTQPDPKSDAHLHIIDETHRFVVEMIGAGEGRPRQDYGHLGRLQETICVTRASTILLTTARGPMAARPLPA